MHTNRSNKQLEYQIHSMLDRVLYDEDLKEDCNINFIDEEEPSFLDERNKALKTKVYEGSKIDKLRSAKYLEDLNYINNLSTTLSCHSGCATTASLENCKRNRNFSFNLNELGFNEEIINFSEQGIENLIIENNDLYNLDKEIDLYQNNINYNNILKLSDRIDEESFKRLQSIFLTIIYSQSGSKLLQKCLKKTEKNVLRLILDEIVNYLIKTFSNPNSNEFCQKLFSYLDQEDKIGFIEHIKNVFIDLGRNKNTSKNLYVFITQFLNKEEKLIIVEFINNHLLELCYVLFLNIGFIFTKDS
jgi:hypothetical protein